MKKVKEQNGITLSTLIITIIVLLILAGTTITLVGENGLIAKARPTAQATQESSILKSIETDILLAKMEGNISESKLNTILSQYGSVSTNSDGNVILTAEDVGDIDITEIYTAALSAATLVSQITYANYGDYVEYEAGGVDDWKIFYNDGEHIFIITSDYLDASLLPESTNMSAYSTYGAYWEDATSNGYKSFGNSAILSLFAFNYDNSYFNSSYTAHQAVAELLDTDEWSKFVDTSLASYAIGSPTIEMWVSSWNSKGYTELYTETDAVGYYIYATDETVSQGGDYAYVADKSAESYNEETNGCNDTLYFPYQSYVDDCWGYLLASQSADHANYVLHIYYYGEVTYEYRYDTYELGDDLAVRPVVCLDANVLGTSTTENGVTTWSLTSGS